MSAASRIPRTFGASSLVTFRPSPASAKPAKSRGRPGKREISGTAALERELQSTKESLQTTIEELETSNEELKSTNEELETTKEEMQSLNEELSTVNAELQSKVDELSRANDDMQNLLNSIEI